VKLSFYASSGGRVIYNGVQVSCNECLQHIAQYPNTFFSQAIDPTTAEDANEAYVEGSVVINGLQGEKDQEMKLIKQDLTLDRSQIDETLIAKDVSFLVYMRDDQGTGLSATQKYETESCAAKPTIR